MSIESPVNTHGVTITFGKHKGQLLTRVPVSYLRWMINENAPQADLARAEFARRGDTMPLVELSGHAIDNASLRVTEVWKRTRNPDEGLYSWLQRMTLEAIERGKRDGENREKISYLGMKLVVADGVEYPVLKTIMRDNNRDGA